LKLLSSWSTLSLFIILLNNAVISNLTPTLTHDRPYTLRGRTATALTSAFICCFLSQRRGEGRIFHLVCWDWLSSVFDIGIPKYRYFWVRYRYLYRYFQKVGIPISIFLSLRLPMPMATDNSLLARKALKVVARNTNRQLKENP
jgi:hypothetical protein